MKCKCGLIEFCDAESGPKHSFAQQRWFHSNVRWYDRRSEWLRRHVVRYRGVRKLVRKFSTPRYIYSMVRKINNKSNSDFFFHGSKKLGTFESWALVLRAEKKKENTRRMLNGQFKILHFFSSLCWVSLRLFGRCEKRSNAFGARSDSVNRSSMTVVLRFTQQSCLWPTYFYAACAACFLLFSSSLS